jgi:hypothetical protein
MWPISFGPGWIGNGYGCLLLNWNYMLLIAIEWGFDYGSM